MRGLQKSKGNKQCEPQSVGSLADVQFLRKGQRRTNENKLSCKLS